MALFHRSPLARVGVGFDCSPARDVVRDGRDRSIGRGRCILSHVKPEVSLFSVCFAALRIKTAPVSDTEIVALRLALPDRHPSCVGVSVGASPTATNSLTSPLATRSFRNPHLLFRLAVPGCLRQLPQSHHVHHYRHRRPPGRGRSRHQHTPRPSFIIRLRRYYRGRRGLR